MDEGILSDPVLQPLVGPDGFVRLRSIVLKEKLGAGGMGAVYLGHHEKLDIDVAVKVLAHAQARGPKAIERFLLEARTAAQIDHPNLVRVLDVDEEAEVHYIVMEYVRGKDAGKVLAEGGPIEEARALEIARSAADALRAAHEKGIVHRDVKPENILIREEDGAVKLADLGLAKAPRAVDSEKLTVTGQVFGTPTYMSPEQIEAPASVDARADIYSLGATLYMLLSGERPFVAENVFAVIRKVCRGDSADVAEVAPALSPGACELVRRMMRLKPDERPPTMTEVVAALDGLLHGGPEVGAAPAAVAAPKAAADARRLEEEAMRAEAMGDLPSALKKYRQILGFSPLERVERRAREIEGMLPLWRAKQAAAGGSPAGKWEADEDLVDLAPGLAAFERKFHRVELPALDRTWTRETRDAVARVACDREALLVGCASGRVERMSPEGESLWRVRPSRKPLRSLAVCGRGGLAAAGYSKGTVAFLRLSDGKVTASSGGHSGAVEELAFLESAGVRTLVSLGADGAVKRWHPSGRELGQLASEAGRPVSFSSTTAVACVGGDVLAWRAPWKDARSLLPRPEGASALALDPTGELLAVALEGGEMLLFSTAAGEELWRGQGLSSEPRGLFFEGERILVAWGAREARSWQLSSSLAESLAALQR